MKKIVYKEVYWQCEVCRKEYHTEALAAECESRPVREPRFKVRVGDRISARYLNECYAGVEGECGHVFLPMIRIARIGLTPAGEGDGTNVHKPEYRATFDCPKCGRHLQDDFGEDRIKPPIRRRKPARRRKKSA